MNSTFANDEILMFTFGNSGLIKLWSGTTGRCLFIQEDKTYEKITGSTYSKDAEHRQVFLQAFFNKHTRLFYVNTVDHNLVTFSIKKLLLDKQVSAEIQLTVNFMLLFSSLVNWEMCSMCVF